MEGLTVEGLKKERPEWFVAKNDLWERFNREPRFTGVGIRADGPVVYVLTDAEACRVPHEVDGVSIGVDIAGPFRFL